MKIALFIHLVLVAAWLSCIFVEVLYERSIDTTPAMRKFISKLHWNTDKFIEIPAFVGVLITGGILMTGTEITTLLLAKVGFGLTAILFNVVCVFMVMKRLAHANNDNFEGWEHVDHKQHKSGAVVLLSMIVAMAIGGYMFTGA